MWSMELPSPHTSSWLCALLAETQAQLWPVLPVQTLALSCVRCASHLLSLQRTSFLSIQERVS
jgi:hypothetical protein